MESLLLLVWFGLFIWGTLGLIKPRLFAFPSRWAALSVWGFSWFPAALASELFPPKGGEKVDGVALGYLLYWAFLSVLVIFIRIAHRAHLLSKFTDPQPENPGFIERWAIRWARKTSLQRVKAGQIMHQARQDFDAARSHARADLQSARASAPSWPKFRDVLNEVKERGRVGRGRVENLDEPLSAIPWKPQKDISPEDVDARTREARRKAMSSSPGYTDGMDERGDIEEDRFGDASSRVATVNARLENQFRRYRAKEISLSDYRSLVADERDDLKDELKSIAYLRRTDPGQYEDERYDIEGALDQTEWRLDWIEDRQEQNRYEREYARSLTPEERGEEPEPEFDGTWAKFDYTTEYGTQSSRDLINWVDKGFKIVGYDRLAKGTRTFNKARMENVRSSNPIPPAAGMPAPVKSYGAPLKGPISEPLTFRYRGQDGVESDQELRNWYEFEKHVSGWCMNSERGRGFSKKKVVEWLGNSESLLG